ncbi:MAG: hypothetical protein HDT36_00485 [Clostridiales bacterium]|nr:hypothetical protein [Clostridiales bacterium]
MITRSYICIEQEDGMLKGIYCHYDGYLEYNGKILATHYTNREKVEKLISLGNLFSLQKNIAPDPKLPHSFDYDKRQKDVCIFYGRDRGYKGTNAHYVTYEMVKNSWSKYMYVFRLNNEWYYTKTYHDKPNWQPVKQSLEKKLNSCGMKDDNIKSSKNLDTEL